MPTKPTLLNTWAGSAPGNRIDPGGAKINQGWNPGEKPPAEWFNFWMHNVSSWLGYLNQLGAGDVGATYGGASTTVQAALDGLSARISALPAAGSVGLSHLTPPSVNSTTPDLWSGASGGLCVPFVYPNGVVSSALYPEYSGSDALISAATSWTARDGAGVGLTFKNLHLMAPVTVVGVRTAFVLRVHGDLKLEAPLSFKADPTLPASYTWQGGASSVSAGGWGGAGVLACGGASGNPSPTMTGGSNSPAYLANYGGYTYTSAYAGPRGPLEDLLRTLPGVGGIGQAVTWMRGGGVLGGTYISASGGAPSWGDFAQGGGVAVIYVSGDIYFGRNASTGTLGQILCNGDDGRAGSATKPGGGGGGGGAVFVICGGRLLNGQGASIGVDDRGLIQANGGAGNTNAIAGGGGGGGGLVYVAARNAHAMHGITGTFSAVGGAGGANTTSTRAGSAGFPGAVVAMRAIPRLMA